MDILIKGMEMKDYTQSITINPGGSVVKDTFGLHRLMDEWKAVALPEHGTLKDTDFMLSCLEEIKKDYPEAYKLVSGIIERTPTIVEASNGTDN